MTILCRSAHAESPAIEAALPAPVTVVATLAEAGEILLREPGERLVVVSIDVPFDDTLAFTSITGARHPGVGIVVIRPELELIEVQQGMRRGVRDVIQVDDLSGLSDACARSLELSDRAVPGVRAPSGGGPVEGKVITVFSAKGGVGKTTIATNLSVALNNSGASRVCLVDLDLAFGDVAITLRLEPRLTIVDALAMAEIQPADLPGILTSYRPNHDCLLAPVAPGDAEKIPATLTTTLLNALSKLYDYVVVDTPSQLSEHVLAALDVSDYHVLITTPELPSLKNLRLSLDTLDMLGYSRDSRAVVLNRSDSNVGLSVAEVERVAKTPLAVRVPSSADVPTSINRGTPLAAAQPDHRVSLAIRRLAAEKFAPELKAPGKHRSYAMSGLRRRGRTS
jgi:pilus assembly protein CpaE